MKHERTNPAGIALLILVMLVFSIVTITPKMEAPVRSQASSEPQQAVVTAPAEEFGVANAIKLRFLDPDGNEIETLSVVPGNRLPQDYIPELPGFLGWDDGNGRAVDVSTLDLTYDMTFAAICGPVMASEGNYFEPDKDGLFHPDRALTRSDTAMAVYELFAEAPKGETFLNDVLTTARCYPSATALVTAGYMQLKDGAFRPDEAITRGELAALLNQLFYNADVTREMADLGDTITRGQAAVLFNHLLGIEDASEGPYYPDVAGKHACFGAITAAGTAPTADWTVNGERRTGFVNIQGYLYYFDENGYLSFNENIGDLHFDENGRYTTGDAELDKLVADVVAGNTKDSMTQEEKLKAVYRYVRDKFLYLRRNYYDMGEVGWEVKEAKTMLSTGKGNCYNFAATFWALSRGVGYDAQIVSGFMSHNRSPHAWTVISDPDGKPYIYDPEQEMQYTLNQDPHSMWKIDYDRSTIWSYTWMEDGKEVTGKNSAGVFTPSNYVKPETTEEKTA